MRFTIRDELLKLGVTKSSYDNALFYWCKNGKCLGIIVLHVDDILYSGTKDFVSLIIEKLKSIFTVGMECESKFKYIGHMIEQREDRVIMHQSPYIESVDAIVVSGPKEKLLDPEEQSMYRAICGQLNWIASHSRPDISFDVCYLSTKLNSATVGDAQKANKTLKKIKHECVELTYRELKAPLHLEIYCDASYANLPNGSSQGGFITFLSDKSGKVVPISWKSCKLRRVVKSTLAAEAMALLDAIDDSVWLTHIINEMLDIELESSRFNTDNKSLVEAVHSPSKNRLRRKKLKYIGLIKIINLLMSLQSKEQTMIYY